MSRTDARRGGTEGVVRPTGPSRSFGPSSVVPGLADLLPRLSALGCLNGLADSTAYYALC